MERFMRYALGPMWIFIGIIFIVEGSWYGWFAVCAGIVISYLGYLRLKRRE